MRASELRIGNWITYNPKSVDKGTDIIPIQIGMISNLDDEFTAKLDEPYDNIYHDGDLLPIRLNRQWLIDFGFEITQEADGYQGGSGYELKKKYPGYSPYKAIEIY